jgi:putative flippase GtrA
MTHLTTAVRGLERLLLIVPQGLLRFLAVGFGGLAVDQSVLWVAEHLGMPFAFARGLAIFIATIFTYVLNRRFTFPDSGRSVQAEAIRYFAVAFSAQSVNYGVSLLLWSRFPHLPHPLIAFIGAVVATVFSYSGQRFFTFAPKPADEARKQRD